MRLFAVFLFLSVFLVNHSFAQEVQGELTRNIVGVKYFSQIMGNVHQNASRYSQVSTTISCNYPVKVLKEVRKNGTENIFFDKNQWELVRVGPYEGFILSEYLTDSKNVCFEEEHSKFFDGLELDINDLYYWARLYDQFVQGKTKVRN